MLLVGGNIMSQNHYLSLLVMNKIEWFVINTYYTFGILTMESKMKQQGRTQTLNIYFVVQNIYFIKHVPIMVYHIMCEDKNQTIVIVQGALINVASFCT